jgi:hypothetical protein
MKRVISVILMREDIPYQNKTLRDILCAIIVSIWLAGFILFMFGIFSIYYLFV